MKTIPEEFKQEFNEEIINIGSKRLILACFSGIIIVPLFGILDYLVVPEYYIFFIKLRIFCVAFLLAVVILFKIRPEFAKKNLYLFSFLTLIAASTTINIMILYFEGHKSHYYAGLLLVIICAEKIFFLNLRQGGIIIGTIYIGYIGSILLLGNITDWPIFISNNCFLLSGIIYALISMYITQRYREDGFLSRLELRQAKNTIQESFTKLTKVDEMKTDFVSSVSHELRTPLTSVIGFASNTHKVFQKEIIPQLIKTNNKLTKKSKIISDNLSTIVSEGKRLTRLINDVLDISKMEAGKIEWDIQELDLIEICKQSLSVVAGYPKSDQVKVYFKSTGICRTVNCDADRMIQVITNLMSNALKFTEQGKVVLKVEFLEKHALVSVQDTGLGISKKEIPEIFSKFRQVGDTLTNKPKGTGLGLPICKEIIEHLGGSIWAESELGKGSCFYFSLAYYQQN